MYRLNLATGALAALANLRNALEARLSMPAQPTFEGAVIHRYSGRGKHRHAWRNGHHGVHRGAYSARKKGARRARRRRMKAA